MLGWAEAEAVGASEVDLIYIPRGHRRRVPDQEQDTTLREGQAEDDRWHLR